MSGLRRRVRFPQLHHRRRSWELSAYVLSSRAAQCCSVGSRVEGPIIVTRACRAMQGTHRLRRDARSVSKAEPRGSTNAAPAFPQYRVDDRGLAAALFLRAVARPIDVDAVGSAGGAWTVRLSEPDWSGSSHRHLEPCMRFSRTRLTDVFHRRHSALPARACWPWVRRRFRGGSSARGGSATMRPRPTVRSRAGGCGVWPRTPRVGEPRSR